MVLKVCILCDELIEKKDDQVDYDILASFYKYDSEGGICGQSDKPTKIHFHKKCFKRFKEEEKKQRLYFTQIVGGKRIAILQEKDNKPFS